MLFSTIANGAQALQQFAQIPLPSKVSYRAAKAINIINPLLQSFEKERMQLFQDLGTPTPDGQLTIAPELQETFRGKFDALMERQVVLPENFLPVQLDMLDGVNVESGVMAGLMDWFIVEA